ncbi:MAG: prepilin peptidase [Rickettsiales bacterium]|jgi:prepilin signal peptidase PulO-like enzyme (type II secretory pathway)|nr:prepilin peptidase [Rickettsiales bacterium]
MDAIFFVFFVIIFGACVGSFLTMAMHRMPAGEDMVFTASHCPKCGKRLRKRSLIPIASFLIQRGKCLECGEKIDKKYILAELANVAAYFALFCFYGASLKTFCLGILFSVIFLISYIDFVTLTIDPRTLIFLFFLAIIHMLFSRMDALGAMFSGGVYYIFIVISEKLTKIITGREIDFIGGGDEKIIAAIGIFLGIKRVGWFFLLAGLLGLLTGLVWKNLLKKNEKFPFAPALLLSLFALLL